MTKITDKYKFVQNTTEKWTGIGLTKLAKISRSSLSVWESQFR